jgi:hypothetical protein
MDIQGRVFKKLPSLTGTGKNGTWHKQEFVVETMEQYPRKIALECWNDDVRTLETVEEGNVVKVNFNIESREHEGRWYTQLRAWKINLIGK